MQEVSTADPATRVPELHKTPGSKSQVWNYFGLEKKDGEFQKGTAICRTCYRRVATENGNTSNLLAHLRTTHSNLHLNLKEAMMKESLATLGVSTSRKRPADELSLAESVDRVQGDANLSFEKLVIGPIILHFFLIIQSFNIFFSISKFQYFLFPSFKVSVNFFFPLII